VLYEESFVIKGYTTLFKWTLNLKWVGASWFLTYTYVNDYFVSCFVQWVCISKLNLWVFYGCLLLFLWCFILWYIVWFCFCVCLICPCFECVCLSVFVFLCFCLLYLFFIFFVVGLVFLFLCCCCFMWEVEMCAKSYMLRSNG